MATKFGFCDASYDKKTKQGVIGHRILVGDTPSEITTTIKTFKGSKDAHLDALNELLKTIQSIEPVPLGWVIYTDSQSLTREWKYPGITLVFTPVYVAKTYRNHHQQLFADVDRSVRKVLKDTVGGPQ
jgi:hypothetical protein